MDHIDAKRVIETRIAESMGFDKYKKIMEWVRKTDVSSDHDSSALSTASIACGEMQSGRASIMICLRKSRTAGRHLSTLYERSLKRQGISRHPSTAKCLRRSIPICLFGTAMSYKICAWN